METFKFSIYPKRRSKLTNVDIKCSLLAIGLYYSNIELDVSKFHIKKKNIVRPGKSEAKHDNIHCRKANKKQVYIYLVSETYF